jgi:hypothetical protein
MEGRRGKQAESKIPILPLLPSTPSSRQDFTAYFAFETNFEPTSAV